MRLKATRPRIQTRWISRGPSPAGARGFARTGECTARSEFGPVGSIATYDVVHGLSGISTCMMIEHCENPVIGGDSGGKLLA